jgi:glycosyltransferase involved in cell wall biosynthesis
MRLSVVIATCGSDSWSDLAFARAFPSARAQHGLAGDAPEVIIQHYPELSVSAARNAAAKDASGDWLCFLDADDELERGYYFAMASKHINGAIFDSWAPLLVPAVRYVGEGFVDAQAAIPNRGLWPRVNECVVGTLIRRSCFEEVGGFREWPSIEDYDLFLRAYDAGAELVYVEDAVYRAHVNPGGGRNADQTSYAAIWDEHLARTRA